MMFKKKKEEKKKTKIEKRVEGLPTAELLSWADQAIYSIGRNLSNWQKSKDNFSLEEARIGSEVLHAIMESLNERAIK
jgi:hypothetical protein